MKKIFASITLLLAVLISFAQSLKNDVILKLNGEELTGKVVKINDGDVEFAYAGETLVYNIKKAEIMKITFGSGRIQVFNNQPQASAEKPQNSPGLEDHHNKVAILPFTFVRDGQPADDAISEQVQNECFSYMSKHAGVFTILNPRTTNAMLIKAGINRQNIKGYTMDDLCNMLGVEYVVDGVVNMNKTTQTTYQSVSGTAKSKDDDKDRKVNAYSYGTATQNFQTKLSLAIYNDKGTSVYDQDRTSFWNTQDAYKNTLEYLLKRSPLYTK
ncbi:hypothetical protein EGT74_19535 [Chitinophaga lutea]|uniref:Uncharacterized protein n=1 Tax=Chitinophaga lutea TaxID=2488634 RepID=A0A3N4PR28_9BACT|nr:hypothetical protein [Chitinophaga lutea]RPE09199.1 hypothetical protein EGT74_19535 [Chitinophaga lutea]